MTEISRRRLLTAVAATSAGATLPWSGARAVTAGEPPHAAPKQETYKRGWTIARQHRTPTLAASGSAEQHAVDFWAKPLCSIGHADDLPAAIVPGMLWYDGFTPAKSLGEHIEYVDATARDNLFAWGKQPRTVARHLGGVAALGSILQSLVVGDQNPIAISRTALLALDSLSPAPGEPDWDAVIPAFAPCYDRIIGHYRLEERGLRHAYAWLDDVFPEQSQTIRNTILQCDAVIFTSAALIENDINLFSFATTAALHGQLMQRLGQALLDQNTLEQIAPIANRGNNKKPRAFALGSVTSTASQPEVDMRDLCRQRELVFGSFGELLRRPRQPLLIATRADEPSADIIRDQLRGTDFLFITTANSDRLRGDNPLEPIELLTLWPFEAESGRCPVVSASSDTDV